MVRVRGEGMMKGAEIEVTCSNEHRQPLVVGKDKDTDFPLEPPEDMHPC